MTTKLWQRRFNRWGKWKITISAKIWPNSRIRYSGHQVKRTSISLNRTLVSSRCLSRPGSWSTARNTRMSLSTIWAQLATKVLPACRAWSIESRSVEGSYPLLTLNHKAMVWSTSIRRINRPCSNIANKMSPERMWTLWRRDRRLR